MRLLAIVSVFLLLCSNVIDVNAQGTTVAPTGGAPQPSASTAIAAPPVTTQVPVITQDEEQTEAPSTAPATNVPAATTEAPSSNPQSTTSPQQQPQQQPDAPSQFTFVPLPTMARCTGSNQFTCEANTTLTVLPSAAPQITNPNSSSGGSGGTSPARIAIIVGSIIGGILLLAAGTFVWNKVRGKDNVGRSLDELSDNKPTTSSGPKPIDPPGGPGGAAGYGGATAVGAAGAGAAAAGLGRRTPGDPGLNGDLGNLPVSGEYRSGNAYSGGGQPGSYGYPDGRSISPTAGSLTPSMSASVVRGDPVNRFDNAPPMPGSSSYAQSYGSQPYPAQQAPYSTATPSNNGPYYSQAYPQQPPSAVAGNGYVQQQPYANSGGYGSNVSYGNPAFNDAPPAGPPFSGYGQQPAQSGYYPKTQPPQGSGYPTQQPYAPGPQQQYGGPPAGQYQQPRQRY